MTNSARRRRLDSSNRNRPQCQRPLHENNLRNSTVNYSIWCHHSNYRPNLISNLLPHHREIMASVMIWKSFKPHISIDPMPSGPLISKIWIKTSDRSLVKLTGAIPRRKIITPAAKKKSSQKMPKAAKCPLKIMKSKNKLTKSPSNPKKTLKNAPQPSSKNNSIPEPSGNAIFINESVTRKNSSNSLSPLNPILQAKRYSATVKKPNVSNFTATASVSIKLVMVATAKDVITWKSTRNKETMQLWLWWTGTQTPSVWRFMKTSIWRDVTARSHTVWRNIANVSRRAWNAGRIANATSARMEEEVKRENGTDWKEKGWWWCKRSQWRPIELIQKE